MSYFYEKALHIIFVVTWFSGMFYLCRLFIYNREALDKPSPEREVLQRQFNLMIKRLLFGITWPSAVLTLMLGSCLVHYHFPIPTWLYIKLGLVLLLFLYQISLHVIYRQQAANRFLHSSTSLRIWNEVPTVFLVGIVMLAVVKDSLSLVYGWGGLVVLAIVLLLAIRLYKKSKGG